LAVPFGCQRGASAFDQASGAQRIDIAVDAPVTPADGLGQGAHAWGVVRANVPEQGDPH
jgi:hypothetical protein